MAEHQHTHTQPEEWRPVIGREGRYEVSSHGRVRSLDRVITTKTGHQRRYKGRMLALVPSVSGYPVVNLGHSDTRLVHRLVLESFVGPAPDGHECCHGDGNRTNSHLSNLRWDTSSANNYDIVTHGMHAMASKTHCKRGHALEGPNLSPYQLRYGWRGCLACKRATDRVRYHPHLKPHLQQVADSYYAEIVK